MAAMVIDPRAWILDATDYDSDAAFRSAVIEELAATEYLCNRLGLGVVSTPIRSLYPDGHAETTGWRFETVKIPAVPMPAKPLHWAPTPATPPESDAALDDAEPERLAEPEPAPEPEPADVSY